MAVGDKQFVLMASQLGTAEGVASLDKSGILSQPQQPPTDSTPTQGSIKPVQSGGVHSSLLNKLSVPQPIPAGTDLNAVTTPGMYYYDGETLPNMPGADNAFSLLVETTGSYGARGRKQTYTPWHQNVTYTRIFSGETTAPWSSWAQLAAATSPWMYDLPLAEGFSGYAKYSIDPFDRVLIMLQGIQKTDASVLGDGVTETIGTIPVGYRPATGINTTAIATDIVGTPIHGIYQLWVDPDGGVRCYAQTGVQATMLRGFLVFQAQN